MKKFWFSLGMALLMVCWGTEGYRGLGTGPAYSQEEQRGEGYQRASPNIDKRAEKSAMNDGQGCRIISVWKFPR